MILSCVACLKHVRSRMLVRVGILKTACTSSIQTRIYRPAFRFSQCLRTPKFFSKKKRAIFATSLVYWKHNRIPIGREADDCHVPRVHHAARRKSLLETVLEFILTLIRALQLFILLSPLLLTYPLAAYFPKCRETWYDFLLREIELCGAIFIKLGQWASTRHDLFPLQLCDKLSRLQRQTTPHPWAFTEQRLEDNFGVAWRDTFLEFDRNPIGSGCIAQVYKAWIKHPEQKLGEADRRKIAVAVKVLHPGIEDLFRRDLAIMNFGAKLLSVIIPGVKWLNLSACVEEFAQVMMAQVDLQVEAENLVKFARNFAKYKNVVFPKPVMELTRPDILVESFENGDSIAQLLLMDKNNSDAEILRKKKTLANLGVHVLLKMVFVDNFVHGDLHPGNILIRERERSPEGETNEYWDPFSAFNDLVLSDTMFRTGPCFPEEGDERSDSELVIIDCGIVAFLHREDLEEKFRDTFRAIILGQGEWVADLFLQTSYHQCEDINRFRNGMARIIQQAREQTITLAKIDVSLLLQQVFDLLASNKVRLESEFSSLLVALMVLEGLGRSLDPTINLLEEARPYLLPKLL